MTAGRAVSDESSRAHGAMEPADNRRDDLDGPDVYSKRSKGAAGAAPGQRPENTPDGPIDRRTRETVLSRVLCGCSYPSQKCYRPRFQQT